VTGEPPTVEATGETVGEAKWKALRELERLEPSLDRAAVRFQVLEEGRRGLLGVGSTPARVVATAEGAVRPEPAAPVDESADAARLRDLLAHVAAALGLRCSIEIDDAGETLTAVCSGGDLGLLIGRHGQTIDAVQTLANAIVRQKEGEHRRVVVDVEGYRDRRRKVLESLAVRCAEDALRSGSSVALEPMSSIERRLVHERLKDYEGVETSSEGDEPNRHVVVFPSR
jgi:spoIIIJ-associated protein